MRYLPLLLLLMPGLALAQSSAISGRVEPGTAGSLAGYTANGTTLSPIASSGSINGQLNIITFGADPSGAADSTTPIQNAVNTACPSGSCTKAVYFPAGNYKVTSLNFTNLQGLVLLGDSAPGWPPRISSIICTEPTNNTGVCVDFTGDFYNRMDNLTISANIGNAPKVLVLLAKNNGAAASGILYKWRNDTFIQQGGDWGTYDYGGEDWTCQNCYWNGTPNHAGLFISNVNTPAISSPYQSLHTAPSSMTIVHLLNSDFSTLAAGTGVNAPVIFDTGSSTISYGEIQGYCNTQSGVPCITDWSSADTGRIFQYTIEIDHEAFGNNPGPVMTLPFTAFSGKVKGQWTNNVAGGSSNPALNFGAAVLWSDIDMIIPENLENAYTVVCNPSQNVLGVTIHNYYQNSQGVETVQRNSCPGAAEIGGIFGQAHATNIDADINRVWNVQQQGAKGDLIYSSDGLHAQDGACTGSTVTAATGAFSTALIGDAVLLEGAGASGNLYIGTVTAVPSATSLTVSPACSTSVSGQTYRIGFDNTAAFQTAVNFVPNGGQGTVYIPAGRYLMLSQVTVGPTHCNTTIAGDNSGTFLMPYFSGTALATTANAFAFADTGANPPQECFGGMRNITFQNANVGVSPSFLNLVRVENEQGLSFQNMRAMIYAGPGDSFFYLDPGTHGDFANCGSTCSFTEQTLIRNINNWFTTNMITFAGNGYSAFSLNNNTLELGQCNPASGGACINMYNWGGNGALLNSKLDFNSDINTVGGAVVRTNHRADDWNGYWTVDIRNQALQSPTYTFDAPAGTGTWFINGSVISDGVGIAQEKNGNPVVFVSHEAGEVRWDAPVTLTSCGTSPTLSTGSTAKAGEVTAGAGATACTISFGGGAYQIGNNNISCHIETDGQPTELYTVGSKGRTGFTAQCRDIATSANCMAGGFFTYGCTGF